MWWVVGTALALGLAAAYLAWTAARVERLHARAAAADRALDAHLLRRAAAAAVLAEDRLATDLYAAARAAIDAADQDREAAENDLTRLLRTTELREGDPAAEAVVEASRRLALARQVHTDLVRDALSARRRPLVRLLRMSRKHERPRYFDVDEPALSAEPGPRDAVSAPESRPPGA